jgi:hypothetical protein
MPEPRISTSIIHPLVPIVDDESSVREALSALLIADQPSQLGADRSFGKTLGRRFGYAKVDIDQ